MATFNPVIRNNPPKEFNTVYIQVNHKSSPAYIRTNMTIHKSGIKKGKIVDHIILANCSLLIKDYVNKINEVDTKYLTVKEVKEFLLSNGKEISFSDFSRNYIEKMRKDGRKKPADNYKTALNSLEKYYKNKNILFSDLTSNDIRQWIKTLENTSRAKNLYPIIINKLFEEGTFEYNNYDKNIIRITNQPFKAVKIPNVDVPEKRSVESSVIRRILSIKPFTMREEIALDVSKIVIYLAGINTADLYDLEKKELKNKKLCYTRKKTEKERDDKAYIEITIPDEISYLIEKYKGKKRLFNFSERYSDPDVFSTAVNKGLKKICEKVNELIDKENESIEKEEDKLIHVPKITVYWLRHTWATVAQNNCGASTELVAFCLNHASAHKTTEKYIKKDFSPIDILNRKVLNYIFKTE